MPTDDERRHLAERLRHEARTCINSVLLSPDAAFYLADLVETAPKCDRGALLALAGEMEAGANYDYEITHAKSAREQIRRIAYYASRIREACGEV